MVQREVKNKTKRYALAAVLSALILVSVIYTVTMPTVMYSLIGASPMKNFASVDALKNYLIANTQGQYCRDDYIIDGYWYSQSYGVYTDSSVKAISVDSSGGGRGFSATNVQVVGVDEVDIVKTDGKYIYVLSDYSTIQIVNADSKNPSVVGKISFEDVLLPSTFCVTGLYLSENGARLAVLGYQYNFIPYIDNDSDTIKRIGYFDYYSFVYVYDVSNRVNPVLARNMTLSGNYLNSRMIGNYLYTVVNQRAYVDDGIVTLPHVSVDVVTQEIAPTCIYYTDMQDTYFSYSTFAGLNIMDDSEQPTCMTILMGVSSCMYVSVDNMYVTFTKYAGTDSSTEIYRIAINGADLTFEAQGIVPGYVLNQYSMDEYNNYFRIATTVAAGPWQGRTEYNNLYVLNMNLNVVGKIENLAKDERIYSVRFAGDKGYIVTFRQIDPFFVLDLKNPTTPKVTGELKIPGYSSYLHPYNENYIIGIGQEDRSVKLSLFDVTDINNPLEIAKYLVNNDPTGASPISTYSFSNALGDPKAFLFNQQKQLLVIPMFLETLAVDGQWQGAYVFQLTPEKGFTLRGVLTHQSNKDNQYSDYKSQINRSLYIDNTLYTVSNNMIQLHRLDNLHLIAKIEF